MSEKDLKWTRAQLLPEGYTDAQVSSDPWVEIIAAAQNNVIMHNYISGTELIQVGDKEIPVWVVNFDGIKGLVPLPESGLAMPEHYDDAAVSKAPTAKNLYRMQSLVGRDIDFVVTHVDKQANLVLLSRKKAMQHKKALTWARLAKNDICKATVRAFAPADPRKQARFAILDITGVRGILPAREVSWGWVGDLRDELSLDQTIEIKIIAKDDNKEQVTASLRALQPDPWPGVPELYKVGNVYSGMVSGVETFARDGANPVVLVFVRLARGVDMAAKLPPFACLERGERVNVRITWIDTAKRRISGHLLRRLR